MKNYTITVNGTAYNVTVEENNGGAPAVQAPVQGTPAPAPQKQAAPAPAAGGKSVDAPMPGNILDVKVKAGDKVAAGTTLVILEAMKMENEIVAPNDGTVVSVNVAKGDTVDSGQSLVTLN